MSTDEPVRDAVRSALRAMLEDSCCLYRRGDRLAFSVPEIVWRACRRAGSRGSRPRARDVRDELRQTADEYGYLKVRVEMRVPDRGDHDHPDVRRIIDEYGFFHVRDFGSTWRSVACFHPRTLDTIVN